MKHTSAAVLLAAVLLPLWPSSAAANHPAQCGPFCMSLFSKIHQHGPLFNYGPYYGYPPFEPYGPWNQYLQYNPWFYGDPNAAGGGGGGGRLFDKFGGFGGKACHGCGLHAGWLHGGWFRGHGCLSCRNGLFGGDGIGLFHHHKAKGECSSCGSPAGGCSGGGCSAVARVSGVGDPRESAQFYAGLPTIDPTIRK